MFLESWEPSSVFASTPAGLKVYFWLWEHLCGQVYIFRRTAKVLGAQLKILGAQLKIQQVLGAPTPKENLMLQKERLGLRVAIWAYSRSIQHNGNKLKNQNISHKS